MSRRDFSLQLGTPEEYPKCTPMESGYHCNNSDELDHCDCLERRDREQCCFYGRPVEPLAFYLPPYSEINQQSQSPLYGVLPKEIRDLVWEYAFADNGILAPDCDNVFRRKCGSDADVDRCDIVRALLRTCKAVYLETYCLPMQLNGYLSYRNNGRSRPDLECIAPWQYALIERLNLSLQQVSIEGEDLEQALADWKSPQRHSGVYVAPRIYHKDRPEERSERVIQAHNFGLVEPDDETILDLRDGDKLTLPQQHFTQDRNEDEYPIYYASTFTARAMVARSITHLTLRMYMPTHTQYSNATNKPPSSRTDWWTWSSDPTATSSNEQLALDPALGMISRPLTTDMLALAASRRSGQHPVYTSTWGAVIGTMQDLKTLELVLESFSVKQHQLEVVVECAKTWRFPLRDTEYELACDGKVETMKWGEATDGDANNSEPGSEDIILDEESEGCSVQDDASPRIQEALHTTKETGPITTQTLPPDESQDDPESIEPTWFHDSQSLDEDDYEYGGTSPVYDADDYADDWDAFPDETWLRTAHEFEIRIVRFRRRRRAD